MRQLPSFKGTVFRGTTLSPEQLARYKRGETITENAFTSTSLDPNSAFYGNTKMKIESVNGKEISILSNVPQEKEVLFKPDTQFKVLNVKVDKLTGVHTIYMREIINGGK